MIKSPLIEALAAERQQSILLIMLEARVGPVPPEVSEPLRAVQEEEKLLALARWAALCTDLESFRQRLIPLTNQQQK